MAIDSNAPFDGMLSFIDKNYSDVGIQCVGQSRKRLRLLLPKQVDDVTDIIVELRDKFCALCSLEQTDDKTHLLVYPHAHASGDAGHSVWYAVVTLLLLALVAIFFFLI